MNARRIFAAAAIAVATAACSGGSSPTLSDNPGVDDGPEVVPTAPPTDTSGFVPPVIIP
ncbi:MAG TPA: hypothetical protein VHG08_05715 [Longimicrobium sp.]|nr:hypothetical protein [Longimicrobium sp.]